MKLKNAILTTIAGLSLGLFLNSCDPTDNPVTPGGNTKTKVAAVTNLRATCSGTNEITLSYTPPADTTNCAGVIVFSNGQPLGKMDGETAVPTVFSMKYNQISVDYKEAPTGKEYKFEVQVLAKDTTKYTNSDKATVTWATANQFDKDYGDGELTLAETASTKYGSGINLYDSDKGTPRSLKIADIEDWTVGVYTKGDSFEFGPANKLNDGKGNYGKNKKVVEISTPQYYDNFGDWFSNTNLDNLNYSSQVYDLKNLDNATKNAIFVVREKRDGKYYYAKVMFVRNADGKFLHGSGSDRYYKVKISYQKTANLPYAKKNVK